MLSQLHTWKMLAPGLFLPLLFLAERRWPASIEARRLTASRPRLGRNLALAAVNGLLSSTWTLPISAWASLHALDWRPADWHGGWAVGLDLVALDLWLYAWHRANHEVGFLWRFHVVHHLDTSLDTSSAIRFHFGEVMLSALARAAFILLFDLPLTSVLVFESLVLLAAAFHHSNLRLPAGFEAMLARFIVTPSIHWVHHHAVRLDTDANYATVLSMWDRCFGTRSLTPRHPSMPIGVEGQAEVSLSQLLRLPFRRTG